MKFRYLPVRADGQKGHLITSRPTAAVREASSGEATPTPASPSLEPTVAPNTPAVTSGKFVPRPPPPRQESIAGKSVPKPLPQPPQTRISPAGPSDGDPTVLLNENPPKLLARPPPVPPHGRKPSVLPVALAPEPSVVSVEAPAPVVPVVEATQHVTSTESMPPAAVLQSELDTACEVAIVDEVPLPPEAAVVDPVVDSVPLEIVDDDLPGPPDIPAPHTPPPPESVDPDVVVVSRHPVRVSPGQHFPRIPHDVGIH
jgi:hypothetical protein